MDNMITKTSRFQPYVLTALRVMTGLLFLQYGFAKILGLLPWPAGQPALFSLIWFAGMIELIGGSLLVLGLFTRITAFICSGEMAVAYFMGHSPRAFFPLVNGGNLAILFCFVFLYFAVAGAGPLSLDNRGKAAG